MIRILYQDEELLVVEKPVGLPAQADAAGGDSLPRRLAEQGLPVLPVHRLDKDTGGVMVYARTKRAAAGLSAIVGQHEVFRKEYIALLSGCPQPPRGELQDLLYHDVRRNKSYVVARERRGVRRAALYSCRLTFPHPITGETVAAACLPDDKAAPWCRMPPEWAKTVFSAFSVDDGADLCYTDR